MQWQYYATTAVNVNDLAEVLAAAGLDGWELVAMTESMMEFTVVFKRPAR